ncbi:MAG: hypothetical protein HKO64_08245, partial [Xanthomonadales bacterium]|nr:hypothetical protein [Xanthomonadales bacterium]
MADSGTPSTGDLSQAPVTPRGAGKPGLVYVILLVLVLFPYAFHLFSFTVFEGFATLSSDSFSYIRQALVWSPYSGTEAHVLNTLPEHVRAPGFSWLLAISGAAESTLRAHLLVSVLLLLSIAVGSWIAYRSAGLVAGIGLAIGFCLLPGAMISSLPILSENLYLLASMVTLMLYERVLRGADGKPLIKFTWRLALLACLLLAILTRSVGLALVAAMVTAALIGPGQKAPGKPVVILVSVLATAGWLSWIMLGTPADIPGEQSYFISIFAGQDQSLADGLAFLWHSINQNISALVRAWIHYLTLTHDNPLLFAGAFLLLAVVMLSTALRALQLKADALYLCAYLAIILLWPFTQGMMRFLHPMVMLLLLQPVLLLGRGSLRASGAGRSLLIGLIVLILIGGGLAAQY